MFSPAAKKTKMALPYWQSVWTLPVHRKFLFAGLGLSLLLFCCFKLFYPYPDFFSDSYSYIFGASANLNINIWPIGYSKFLWIIHSLTHSALALVSVQYFLIQFAALHFYFTILYFFSPVKWIRVTLFFFIFVNPLSLYLSNTVNSDALFAALSLLWITELIWIVQKPLTSQVIVHAILLFFCFTVRNNAYYYPVIAACAFSLSHHRLVKKVTGVLFPMVLIVLFISFTRNACFKLTGTRQFSLFTGWQMANNALYIYDKITVDSSLFTNREANELNRISVNFFAHLKSNDFRSYLESYVGNFFIREPEAPLKHYYGAHFYAKTELELVKTWAKASQIFESFGQPLVLHHPTAYFRYFIYPNAWNYLVPPLSHLERYDYGGNDIEPIAQHWFDFRAPKVNVYSNTFQGKLLWIYPWLFFLINSFYFWQLLSFSVRKKRVFMTAEDTKVIILVGSFLLLNLAFSLVATVNILRYQFVPMIVMFSFSLVLEDCLELISVNRNNSSRDSLPSETSLIKAIQIRP